MLTLPEMGRDVINKFDCIQSLSTELNGFSNQWTQITKDLEVCKRRISFFGSESIWIDHQSAQMSDLLSESLSFLESIKVELEIYKSRCRNSNCCCRIFNCTTKLPDFALEQRLFRLDDVPFKTFNSRYVHLSAAESDIVGALNSTQFSTIILYGRRGSGKSTLAIYMALQYLDRVNNRSLQFPKPLTRSLSGDLSPLFERVFFLKCGLNVDAVSKYQEFCQLYGPKNSEDENTLVVLDDVCDHDFLQDLIGRCDASHTKIRYFVTSVEGTPKITNSKSIEIRVLQTEALSILASHIGFPENVIPDNLQDMADRVIKLVDASPLELVRFASEVRIEQTDLAVWRKAELKLLTENYSKSSTEQQSLMSLSTAAQNLLVLIYTCNESSIPEDVLQVMYASSILQGNSTKFFEARSELETKEWITITSQPCEWNSEVPIMKRHMLSIRPWHLQLVGDGMKEEVEMLTCAIFGEVERELSAEDYENSFMMILGAFYLRRPSYFDGICAERVSKIGIDMQNLEMERRSAIKPLLWLIPPKSQCNEDGCDWDETSCYEAKKVILGYVCKNLVKDSLVSNLLKRSYSRRATCWALMFMLQVDRQPIIGRKTLLHFLISRKTRKILLDSIRSWVSEEIMEILLDSRRFGVSWEEDMKILLEDMKILLDSIRARVYGEEYKKIVLDLIRARVSGKDMKIVLDWIRAAGKDDMKFVLDLTRAEKDMKIVLDWITARVPRKDMKIVLDWIKGGVSWEDMKIVLDWIRAGVSGENMKIVLGWIKARVSEKDKKIVLDWISDRVSWEYKKIVLDLIRARVSGEDMKIVLDWIRGGVPGEDRKIVLDWIRDGVSGENRKIVLDWIRSGVYGEDCIRLDKISSFLGKI